MTGVQTCALPIYFDEDRDQFRIGRGFSADAHPDTRVMTSSDGLMDKPQYSRMAGFSQFLKLGVLTVHG